MSIKVLCIEGDDACLIETDEVLKNDPETFEVDICNTLQEGLTKLEYCAGHDDPMYDVILLDLKLPNGEGLAIFEKVLRTCRRLPIVIISEFEDKALECVKRGAQDYIIKPDQISILPKSLRYSIERFKIDQRYAQLVESTHASIYEIDFTKQCFTYVNDKTCEYSGYTKSELMKMNPFQLLTADGKALFAERIEKLMKGEFISNTEEYQIIKKDGTKRWALITADYVVKKEQIVGARVVALDITERKRRLRLIENVFDNSPVALGILEYDEGRRRLTHVNKFMCSMLGYTCKELIGSSALLIYPSKEEFDRVGKFKFELIEKGLTATIETQWKKKDGTIIDVLLTTAPLDKTEPYGSNTFTAMDITKEKEEERYLNRQLESRLSQWRKESQNRILADNQIKILNQIIAGVKNDN